MEYEEKTVSCERIFTGNILNFDIVTVKLPNGKESTREIISHPGAAVIIPIADNGDLYLVRQFRKAVEKEMLELPAGKLDPGELPLDCAVRELKEETGLEAQKVELILSIHSTPGFSNEVLHIFAARGLKEGSACADEDEFLSIRRISMNSLIKMIFNGEITDSKTIVGIFAAERIIKGELDLIK